MAYVVNASTPTGGIVLLSNPGVGVSGTEYTVDSADDTIVAVVDTGQNHPGLQYVSAGSTAVTVTRLSDGSTRTHTVTAIDDSAPPEDWDWSIGTLV